MATLGMTKIDAVNACLLAISEYRVSALDTGGTSIQADAERCVDDSTRYFCAMGWPCNSRKAVPITPHTGTFICQATGASNELPTGTLAVQAAGNSQHRHLVLRGDTVYDADNGTTNFGSQSIIYMDIAELLTFVECDPMLKEEIAQHAAQRFARRRVGSPLTDGYLSNELALTDTLTKRAGALMGRPLFVAQQAAAPAQ